MVDFSVNLSDHIYWIFSEHLHKYTKVNSGSASSTSFLFWRCGKSFRISNSSDRTSVRITEDLGENHNGGWYQITCSEYDPYHVISVPVHRSQVSKNWLYSVYRPNHYMLQPQCSFALRPGRLRIADINSSIARGLAAFRPVSGTVFLEVTSVDSSSINKSI